MELMTLPKIGEVEIKELESYEQQALSVTDEAKLVARAIHDAATHEAAAQWVSAKKAWCKRIKTGWLGDQISEVFKLHKKWCAKRDELVYPVEGDDGRGGAIGIVIDAQLAWKRQEDKRIAEQQAAEMAAAKKKDEDERLAAAEKLEAAGNKTMADKVLAETGNFVAPVVRSVKSEKVSYRKVWKVRFDPAKKGELLKMIADRQDLHAFVEIDINKIQRHAATMDGNLVPAWPGVTPYQDDVPVYR